MRGGDGIRGEEIWRRGGDERWMGRGGEGGGGRGRRGIAKDKCILNLAP